MTRLRPLPRLGPVALAALVALGSVSCSDAGADASSDTSDVTRGMLESRGGGDGPDGAPASIAAPGADAEAEPRASTAPGRADGSSGAQSPDVDVSALGYTVGDPEAPLQVVEFSDFGCGYCKRFHTDVWPAIEERYVESGKIEWKHIPMILGIFGKNADEAAEAAECALEQDRFEAYEDRLFVDQSAWKGVADPFPVLERFAAEEGLDVDAWSACMASDRTVVRVEAGTKLSRQVGVRGTPTFFIVGVGAIPGLVPLETFQQVLDTVYAQATRQ